MLRWREFVDFLAKDVDWDASTTWVGGCPELEWALKEIGGNHDGLRERVEEIVSTPKLLGSYAPHMGYPAVGMDKFILHMDQADRFRIRFHRFRSKLPEGLVEDIHGHKYGGGSVTLLGAYTEERYAPIDVDDRGQTCRLERLPDQNTSPGSVYSFAPCGKLTRDTYLHRIKGGSEPAFTIFIRGKAMYETAPVFYPCADSDRYVIDLQTAITKFFAAGLRAAAMRETDFPLFEVGRRRRDVETGQLATPAA